MDVNLIIVLLFGMCTRVLSQDGGKLADQPLKANYELERLMGRWYLVYMASGRNEQGEGSVIDLYHENGKFFIRNAYLTPSGECLPSTDMEIRRQKNKDYFTLYAEEQRVADLRSFGRDFVHYGLYHFCITVEGGVCQDTFVQIWSRTKQLPNNLFKKAKEETKKICLQPHIYHYVSGNYEECPGPESSRDTCQLRYIPNVRYLNTRKLLGRWYLVYMAPGRNKQSEGSVIDLSCENGTFYIRNAYLSPSGECLPSTNVEIRRQKNGCYFTLYTEGQRVADLRSFGGDYVHYGLYHFCITVEGGVCQDPFVQIWSRTKQLTNHLLKKAKEETKKICLQPNIYHYVSGKYEECQGRESSRDICQLRYIPYVRYLNTGKLLGVWYLIGWYNHPGGDPSADMKGSVIKIQQRNGVLCYVLYIASENSCKKLARVTLKKTSSGGQMRQYGGSHDGSETYIVYIDYNRYLVSWICTKMDNGVCTKSVVQVWSRTPTLPEADMNEARAYKKLLCKPEREVTYGGHAYGVCEHVSSSATKAAVLAPGRLGSVVVCAIFWILFELM